MNPPAPAVRGTTPDTTGPAVGGPGFEHSMCRYSGNEGFLAGTMPFIEAGLAAGDAVLVVVPPAHIDVLRDGLGADVDAVQFADMTELGRNPALIIPAWQAFVDAQIAAGRTWRGIGEPLWPGRRAAERRECHIHESLLNVAFGTGAAWPLLCPYDADALDPGDVARAGHTHPFVAAPGPWRASAAYDGAITSPFTSSLDAAPADARELEFAMGSLRSLRRFVSAGASAAGLDDSRTEAFVLATSEVATNSILHGRGAGTARMWIEDDVLVCDVVDAGGPGPWDPLVGRRAPCPDRVDGRGLWLVNHLCDLVQISTGADGTTVRLHVGCSARGLAAPRAGTS
jgi:anti-sigma regulatory factor (Ser/Thr protein kinase)